MDVVAENPGDSRTARERAGFAIGVATFFLCFALAWAALAFTRTTGGIALIWPCNAIVVALALRARAPSRAILIAIATVAIGLANAIAQQPSLLSLVLPLIDALEIALTVGLISRFAVDARTLPGFGKLSAIAVPAAALSATLSAGTVAIISGAPFLLVAYPWFASNMMGLLVLLPMLLAINRSDLVRLRRPSEIAAAATIALVTAVIAAIVFYRAAQPMLFIVMPCMVFAAFRLRFVGAALSLGIMVTIGTIATFTGHGPISTHFPSPDRILYLQAFVAIGTLTTLPIAIMLSTMSRAFRRVREARQQLHLLTDNANDMIVRLGLDATRRYVSPASERMLGYTPAEMLAQEPWSDIHPDDRIRLQASYQALIDGAADQICIYRKRNSDGDYVWLEGAFRLVIVNGEPREIVGTIRDVTRRRIAEQAATRALADVEERERLLGMSEQMARVGTWRFNWVDRTVFWSPEMYRIHGVTRDHTPELDTGLGFYHPDDRARVQSLVDEARAKGGAVRFEARVVQPSGAIRWVALSAQSERAISGEVVGMFGIFQDITEQVETLRAVVKAREEAETALAAKAQFTATISHEIRTPLTSILSTASLLRTSSEDGARGRHLDTLERSGHLLAAIVDDVLLFSKLSEGHGEPEAIEFDLAEVVNDVVTVFTNDASAKGLSIAMAGAEESRWVVGDPARLARVLTNLVGNALKFTTLGGVAITLRAPKQGDVWTFDVEDTGVGIRADRVEAIFEPFVQADASTTRSYGGTGLGLSISRLLVESMGGEIGVEAGLYRGSCFRFTVPLPPAKSAQAARGSTPGSPGDARKRVLLAEDNETNRYLIAELVRQLGHDVVVVENGEAAVEAVIADDFEHLDIVLMDVQMPVKDGIEATSEIRALDRKTPLPIFALTADNSIERRRAIFDAGMNGLLAKPVDIDMLRAAIEGRTTANPPQTDRAILFMPAAIDPDRIAGIEATLGADARDVLLQMLVDDALRIPRTIREMVAAGRPDQAKFEAHRLRGAAASVGAYQLVDILMQVELDATNQEIADALLSRLEFAANEVASSARSILAASKAARELSLSSSS